MRKSNQKNIIPMIIAIATVVIIATGLVIFLNSDKHKVSKQLKVGQKYYDDGNYEMAIESFELALDIEGSNKDAQKLLIKASEKQIDELMEDGKYKKVRKLYEEIEDYLDNDDAEDILADIEDLVNDLSGDERYDAISALGKILGYEEAAPAAETAVEEAAPAEEAVEAAAPAAEAATEAAPAAETYASEYDWAIANGYVATYNYDGCMILSEVIEEFIYDTDGACSFSFADVTLGGRKRLVFSINGYGIYLCDLSSRGYFCVVAEIGGGYDYPVYLPQEEEIVVYNSDMEAEYYNCMEFNNDKVTCVRFTFPYDSYTYEDKVDELRGWGGEKLMDLCEGRAIENGLDWRSSLY